MPASIVPGRPLARALAVAALVALLASLATYATVAATAGADPVNATAGHQETLVLASGEEHRHELSWTTNLTLEAPPAAYQLAVAVPYSVRTSSPEAPGAEVWTNATVDGEPAGRHRYGGSPGEVRLAVPGPHLDTATLSEGVNEIRVHTTIHRPAEAQGTATVAVGPLQATPTPRDADGDGVPDPEQPVPGLHTAWISAATGLGVAAVAGYTTLRLGRAGEDTR